MAKAFTARWMINLKPIPSKLIMPSCDTIWPASPVDLAASRVPLTHYVLPFGSSFFVGIIVNCISSATQYTRPT